MRPRLWIGDGPCEHGDEPSGSVKDGTFFALGATVSISKGVCCTELLVPLLRSHIIADVFYEYRNFYSFARVLHGAGLAQAV
jgi:hypothetical protein